jgi:non-homologous end joining protein Ku
MRLIKQVGRVALAEMVESQQGKSGAHPLAKRGLVLQTMFYANEVRDFAAIPKAENQRPTRGELELAQSLRKTIVAGL